jgi:AcrR family transcriptional regulator
MGEPAQPATPPSFPWWPPDRPAGGGRTPLTRERVVAAALALIDREGLDALSMRRLGLELGAAAPTLYWHVASKDQLLDLIVDEILGDARNDMQPTGDWRDLLAEAARALRRVLLRHRNAAPLIGERLTMGPKALDALEWLLGTLIEAGFDPVTAVFVYNAVVNLAAGWAVFESRTPQGALAEGRTPEELDEMVRGMVKALPRERFPNLVAASRELTSSTENERFEFTLQRLLDGIQVDRDRRAASTGAG